MSTKFVRTGNGISILVDDAFNNSSENPIMNKTVATAIASLPKGVVYKGAVDYYASLPATPNEGDAYTVRYAGTEGSVVSGAEYVWGKDGDSNTWIKLGDDMSLYVMKDDEIIADLDGSADLAAVIAKVNAILAQLRAVEIVGTEEADE